ncbi:MAG: hypothetical protein ACR2FH_03040, partial [Caulobacteraceae bacterium]
MSRSAKQAAGAMAALALAAGGAAFAPRPAEAQILPAYFNPGDASRLAPVMFMRLAPPPNTAADTKTLYPYGPITDSFSQNVDQQNTSTWRGRDWPLVWANRSRVPAGKVLQTSNPIVPAISGRPGVYGMEFTTVT